MEFGDPLGNRSILKPKRPTNEKKIKQSYKKEKGSDHLPNRKRKILKINIFTMKKTVPYMNQVVQVKEHQGFFLPSITHIDGSPRIQT